MSDFRSMAFDYEGRKVDRYKVGDLFVSTVRVTDSAKPFETGVVHPAYNNNEPIVVELYNTKEEAQEGHNKWVKIMTARKLPWQLVDVGSNGIAISRDVTDKGWRIKEKGVKR